MRRMATKQIIKIEFYKIIIVIMCSLLKKIRLILAFMYHSAFEIRNYSDQIC